MALLDLANELLLSVVENLNKLSDHNAFARTNRRLYFLLNSYLYRVDVQQGESSALLWAAEHGLEGTAQLSLAEGANCETTRDIQPSNVFLPRVFHHGRLFSLQFHFDEHRSAITQPLTILTSLQLAVGHRHEPVARLLIKHGADIRKAYPERMARCTVLHLASAYGLTSFVQLLLEKGAKLEARDMQGQTPLHYAVKADEYRSRWYGNIKTALCLLEKGARYNTRDRSGRSPKDLATEHVSGWRWSEQEQENDNKAEKRMKQLLEAKDAERSVEKWDRDRELRKKRVAAEKALRESLAKSKIERTLHDRLRKEAQLQQIAKETETRRERAEEIRLEAQSKAKEDLQKRVEETARRERQEAARKDWSQLREQAEQKARAPGNCRARASSGCSHSSLGWLKNKARAPCQICDRICAKSSFQCPDCGCVACMHCKLQRDKASVKI